MKQEGVPAAPTFDQFIVSLAENGEKSGWDSQNATTGAYGRFQITPTNWRNWGDAAYNYPAGTCVAGIAIPPTSWYPYPDQATQTFIARWRLLRSWNAHGGDARYVAAMWEGGAVGDVPPQYWPERQKKYVDRVCVPLGYAPLPR